MRIIHSCEHRFFYLNRSNYPSRLRSLLLSVIKKRHTSAGKHKSRGDKRMCVAGAQMHLPPHLHFFARLGRRERCVSNDLGISPPHKEQKGNRNDGPFSFSFFFFSKTLFHCSTFLSQPLTSFTPQMAALSRLASLQARLLAFLDKYPKTLDEFKQPQSLVRVLATLVVLNALRKVETLPRFSMCVLKKA